MNKKDDKKAKQKGEERKVSVRDIVYAEIDDEITVLVDRLRRVVGKEVYLVVPQRAVLFQSSVNLRILERMASELGKSVYIVTADRRGRKMAEEVGLSMVERLEGVDYVPRNLGPSLAVSAIRKKKDDGKERGKEKRPRKISIARIIESERPERPSRVREGLRSGGRAIRDKVEEVGSVAPNRRALFGFLGVVVLIFLGVMWVALPSATVRVEPNSDVIEKTVNLIFSDAEINPAEVGGDEPRMVPVWSVETIFEKSLQFNATEKVFTGSRARGWVRVYNETVNDWDLVGGTRFQTEEGVVFRVGGQVQIPGGREAVGENGETVFERGSVLVEVVADEMDAYDDVIGERGNVVEGTGLFLPGLSEYNQKLLYGEVAEDFAGGVTDFYTIVSGADLEAAREFILIDIEGDAKDELRQHVEERDDVIGRQLRLFEGGGSFEREVLEVSVPTELTGTEAGQFTVSARMRVKGMAYDYGLMLSILERELRSAVHPDKVLKSVNTEGVSLRVLDETRNERTGKVTVVAVIEGVEVWNLDQTTEAGSNLAEKIRAHVMGKSKADAERYVRNLREVRNVEVSVWPFWSPSLPSVGSSVGVEVM